MPTASQPFLGQPLRRVRYYRPQSDANLELNWPGRHDVGQGIELGFDAGEFFVTWDTAAEEGVSIHPGRMQEFLRAAVFEDVSAHPDWQEHIGQPLAELQLLTSEVRLQFGEKWIFIVTAEIDPETMEIDGMADNLVVFFRAQIRDAFFAQYPGTQGE